MKRDKRGVYIVLSGEVDGTLCSFCRYASWDGFCGDKYCVCESPFEAIYDRECELAPQDDCWGFSPILPVRDIADIVGMVLSEHFRDWAWQKNGNQIMVFGEKTNQGGENTARIV